MQNALIVSRTFRSNERSKFPSASVAACPALSTRHPERFLWMLHTFNLKNFPSSVGPTTNRSPSRHTPLPRENEHNVNYQQEIWIQTKCIKYGLTCIVSHQLQSLHQEHCKSHPPVMRQCFNINLGLCCLMCVLCLCLPGILSAAAWVPLVPCCCSKEAICWRRPSEGPDSLQIHWRG